MKKALFILCCVLGVISPLLVRSQIFKTAADTVWYNVSGAPGVSATITNNITIPGASAVNIKWQVVGTNFPADWLTEAVFGICDADLCQYNTHDSLLWFKPDSSGSYFTCSYAADTTSLFDLSLNFTTATSSGCYFMTVMLSQAGLGGYSKPVTFIVCKAPLNVPSVTNAEDKIALYPNPASNELNVIYDANADVKNVTVYNIIGKPITVYKVAGNSANLNISNLPSGIYFVRLFNSKGNMVVTRKFTKQ